MSVDYILYTCGNPLKQDDTFVRKGHPIFYERLSQLIFSTITKPYEEREKTTGYKKREKKLAFREQHIEKVHTFASF